MKVDGYRLALSEGGKLKLRAVALLAEGGRERAIDAAVLLHDAARAEARGLLALDRVPPETALAAAIEECWCLLEGGDPSSAALAWENVRVAAERVPEPVASAMRSRLDSFYATRTRAYAEAIAGCKTLNALRPTRNLVPSTKKLRTLLDGELTHLLDEFPGVASFWWAKYRIAEVDGDDDRAWTALRTACRLEPQNARFASMMLLLAARARSVEEADELLAAVDGASGDPEPEVSLAYAFAEIELARRAPKGRVRRWEKARHAAESGLGRGPRDALRRSLTAVRLLAVELLAGREATLDILYRAGLGALAASVSTARKIAVVDLLQRWARTEIEADERAAA